MYPGMESVCNNSSVVCCNGVSKTMFVFLPSKKMDRGPLGEEKTAVVSTVNESEVVDKMERDQALVAFLHQVKNKRCVENVKGSSTSKVST